MICKQCKSAIPDGSVFCPDCGVKVDDQASKDQAPQPPQTDDGADERKGASQVGSAEAAKNKVATGAKEAMSQVSSTIGKTASKASGVSPSAVCGVGIAFGAIWIVVGFVLLLTSSFTMESTSFGADFYTYVYKAVQQIGELMLQLVRAVSVLLIAFGAFVDCYFTMKMRAYKSKE